MEAQGGSDKVKAGRDGAKGQMREEAELGKGVFGEVMAYAEPIVEALQGQVGILGGLELEDGQASGGVGGEEVDESAILGGECRDLAVDG